ncbi:unnamed protein product, partial [Mesorhabditis belari]|uniref:Uncharacterized protein n=1 Tax=Mesorhabditis belari TaxID=2138241 RepID=A0AAF3EJN4_9BILA
MSSPDDLLYQLQLEIPCKVTMLVLAILMGLPTLWAYCRLTNSYRKKGFPGEFQKLFFLCLSNVSDFRLVIEPNDLG